MHKKRKSSVVACFVVIMGLVQLALIRSRIRDAHGEALAQVRREMGANAAVVLEDTVARAVDATRVAGVRATATAANGAAETGTCIIRFASHASNNATAVAAQLLVQRLNATLAEDASVVASLQMRTRIAAALSRISALDTGTLASIPLSHFSLHQPLPPVYTFNATAAISYALADVKYMFECGADAKRDIRFTDAETCAINSTQPEPKGPPPMRYNMKLVHESLKDTLRAWSRFAERERIAWWISHGELLSHYWNGDLFPWDVDLDLQTSTFGLMQLVPFNQTVWEGRYLLDVSPNVYVRSRQPNNVIDARVIDTSTGHFLDITGLTLVVELNPPANTTRLRTNATISNENATRYEENATRSSKIVKQHMRNATRKNWTTRSSDMVLESHDVVSCKSPHEYKYVDLMPLHETLLAGIPVLRPRAEIKLLKQEYSEKALYAERYRNLMSHETFQWNRKSLVWVSIGNVDLDEGDDGLDDEHL